MAPRPGDLIRYSPHRGSYEIPPADPVERAYWSIDGCIAVVCRAEDKACFDRYRQGVFRTSDGVQLSPYTFKPLKHAAAIDPDSLLPAETSKPGAPGYPPSAHGPPKVSRLRAKNFDHCKAHVRIA